MMYYRFVDHDTFMRFLGIGIRHCNQHSTDAELVAGHGPRNMDEESDGHADAEGEVADDEDNLNEDNYSDEDGGTDDDEFDGDSDDIGYDEL